jgi:hypothetical protein
MRRPTTTCTSKSCENKCKALLAINMIIFDKLYFSSYATMISFVFYAITSIIVACSLGGKEARFLFFYATSPSTA